MSGSLLAAAVMLGDTHAPSSHDGPASVRLVYGRNGAGIASADLSLSLAAMREPTGWLVCGHAWRATRCLTLLRPAPHRSIRAGNSQSLGLGLAAGGPPGAFPSFGAVRKSAAW